MTPILATFLWLADKFGKDAIESGVKLGWDAARWQRAANQYADKIERDYGRLPIFGKDRYVPIDEIYTYVHVLNQEDAYFQFAEDKLAQLYVGRNLSYDPDTRQDGWRMVAEGDDLFILGDPGSGKTTFLKMAAIKAARGELRRSDDTPARIPIFIALRQHAHTRRSLYESVKHELNVCGFPEADLIVDALLRSGRALLLWDALDEVATDEDQRSILVAEMHDFMRKYDRCQYVISCRIAAADYTFHERRLHYVKMAPFSDNQIERYLVNWFGDKHELATDCVEELQEERHKGLRELARTPILLTLLAIAYEETLSFPSRRVDIYYQAIEALLRKWDADRGIRRDQEVYAGLELGYKWDLMTEVAADAFNNGEFLMTRQEWGDRIRDYLEALPGISPGVDGGLVLDSMAERHGLFVQQTPRLYSLPHLSFQEYFTARDIKENIQHGSLERLVEHVGEDQWREVVLLVAGSLRRRDAETFFAKALTRIACIGADSQNLQRRLAESRDRAQLACVETNYAYKAIALRFWFLDNTLLLSHKYRSRKSGSELADAMNDEMGNAGISWSVSTESPFLSIWPFRTKITVQFGFRYGIELDPNLALDSLLHNVLSTKPDVDFEVYSPGIMLAIDQIKNLCEELDQVRLLAGLNELRLSKKGATQREFDCFQDGLATIVKECRNLSNYRLISEVESGTSSLNNINWEGKEAIVFGKFVKGTIFLIDCLKLATIANRSEIEDRLLLPVSDLLDDE